MSSDPRFLEAWVNHAGHRVFGRKLHPLCFLDLVALEVVDSPFLPGSKNRACATRHDFNLAVHILSAPIKSLELSDRIARPSLVSRMVFSRYDLAKANAALQAYFDDYFTTLEMWREPSAGKSCQAPWVLAQAAFLMQHTSLSEWRIWTAPIGQMLCYCAALEEQLSQSQVVSPEERKIMEGDRNG